MIRNKFIDILYLSVLLFTFCHLENNSYAKNVNKITIDSNEMVFYKNNNKAIFTGNVIIIQEKQKLTANKITAYFSSQKKNSKNNKNKSVERIEAEGNVVLKTLEENISADFALYDINSKIVTLTKNVVIRKGQNSSNGDKFVYNLETGISKLFSNEQDNNGKKNRVRAIIIPESIEEENIEEEK